MIPFFINHIRHLFETGSLFRIPLKSYTMKSFSFFSKVATAASLKKSFFADDVYKNSQHFVSPQKIMTVKGRIHCEIFLSEHFMKYSFRVIS